MIESVRGVRAIEGSEAKKYQVINDIFNNLCKANNYELIVLPTIEKVELFSHTVGEFSDIVTKQMYNFTDKKGRELVLRPEGTAGVMRNYIEKKYSDKKKYYYSGQMFRYERPQKGRYREFHQVGAEIIGNDDISIDPVVEIVLLGVELLNSLNKKKDGFTLKINSIGTNDDRKEYTQILYEYFDKYRSKLSEESLIRLENNPLRILDSINQNDIEIVKDAPRFSAYRSKNSNQYYETFKEKIDCIAYEEDENLVRGLDYYNGITFEYIPKGKTGSQETLGGGGQYDSLSTLISDRQINGIGFAFGVDRIIQYMES